MTNRHMKRCPTSLDMRKMQVKTAMRYYFTPARMAIIKKTTITNVGEDVEKRELLYSVDGNVNLCSYSAKQFGASSKN